MLDVPPVEPHSGHKSDFRLVFGQCMSAGAPCGEQSLPFGNQMAAQSGTKWRAELEGKEIDVQKATLQAEVKSILGLQRNEQCQCLRHLGRDSAYELQPRRLAFEPASEFLRLKIELSAQQRGIAEAVESAPELDSASTTSPDPDFVPAGAARKPAPTTAAPVAAAAAAVLTKGNIVGNDEPAEPKYCTAHPTNTAAAPGGGGGGGGGGDHDYDNPEHPCPICLASEDDHGKYGQCFACGQLYCGDCNVPERLGRVATCPTCRAPFAVSAEVNVARLVGLLARSHGQHTPAAQYSLGVMYAEGIGVAQDPTEAARLYHLAADQGFAHAQCNLGQMYDNGTGVAQDHAEAVRLYLIAADQGYAIAQCSLPWVCQNSTGTAQDHAKAAQWYRLAADQGNADAQCNLGWMYKTGTGVPQNHAEAMQCFRLAADQGLIEGQFNLGVMYKNGDGVAQDDAEAARWYPIASDQGFAQSQLNLGEMEDVRGWYRGRTTPRRPDGTSSPLTREIHGRRSASD